MSIISRCALAAAAFAALSAVAGAHSLWAQGTYSNAKGHGQDAMPAFASLYKPEQTVVVILPVVDEQPNQKADLEQRYEQKAQQELSMRFSERGFKIMSDKDVLAYLDAHKIDLTDEENRNRRTLYDIGHGLHANLVALLDIVKTEAKWHGGTFIIDRKREGTADLKMWLVDADREEPILSGARTEAKSSANDAAVFLGGDMFNQMGGSQFTIRAIGNGVKDLLKPFLADYPVTHPSSDPDVVDKSAAAHVADSSESAPAVRPATSVSNSGPAPAPQPSGWYVYTLKDGSKYVGEPDGTNDDNTVQFIKNSLGRRALHTDQITSRNPVQDEATGKSEGAAL